MICIDLWLAITLILVCVLAGYLLGYMTARRRTPRGSS